MTAVKARNSVRQTGASVKKQTDFVTASVMPVIRVKIRISHVIRGQKIFSRYTAHRSVSAVLSCK